MPSTMEIWVADNTGSPVFMVMAEPSSSLVNELCRLVPTLRTMVGVERRVLIGFDREGWSPQLFHDLIQAGFDPLTWRKGETTDLDRDLFTEVAHTDRWGTEHSYAQVADTTVELSYGSGSKATVFAMRQVSRIVAAGKQATEAAGGDGASRQIHVPTSNTALPAAHLLFLASHRWRHENYFRYAKEHLALDAHDSYASVADDPGRMAPNPAKAAVKTKRDAIATRVNALVAVIEARELELASLSRASRC